MADPIGELVVRLTGDGSGLRTTLAHAEKSVKALDQSVQASAKATAAAANASMATAAAGAGKVEAAHKSLVASTAGAATGFVSFAGTATALAGVFVGAASAIGGMNTALRQFAEAAKEGEAINNRLLKSIQGETVRLLKNFEALPAAEKEAFASQQVERLTQEVQQLNTAIERSKRLIAKGTAPILPSVFSTTEARNQPEQLKVFEGRIEQVRETLALWKREMEGVKNVPAVGGKQLLDDVNRLNERLQDQIGVLAQGADAFEAWKLAQRAAAAEQPPEVRQAAEEQLRAARAAIEAIRFQERQAKDAEQAAQAQAKAVEEAAQAQKKMMADGKALAESLRSPQEQLTARVEELTAMFKAGAIDVGVFEKAVLAARQSTDDAAKATAGMNRELGRIDSVAFGSAEAMSRYQEYLDRIRDDQAAAKKAGAKGNAVDFAKEQARRVEQERAAEGAQRAAGAAVAAIPAAVGRIDLGGALKWVKDAAAGGMEQMRNRHLGNPERDPAPDWVEQAGRQVEAARRAHDAAQQPARQFDWLMPPAPREAPAVAQQAQQPAPAAQQPAGLDHGRLAQAINAGGGEVWRAMLQELREMNRKPRIELVPANLDG